MKSIIHPRRLLICALSASLFAFGCDDDNPINSTDGGTDATPGQGGGGAGGQGGQGGNIEQPCDEDTDCPTGEQCVEGFCNRVSGQGGEPGPGGAGGGAGGMGGGEPGMGGMGGGAGGAGGAGGGAGGMGGGAGGAGGGAGGMGGGAGGAGGMGGGAGGAGGMGGGAGGVGGMGGGAGGAGGMGGEPGVGGMGGGAGGVGGMGGEPGVGGMGGGAGGMGGGAGGMGGGAGGMGGGAGGMGGGAGGMGGGAGGMGGGAGGMGGGAGGMGGGAGGMGGQGGAGGMGGMGGAPGPECGNGVIEAGEQCDDGNTDAEDGCDADCQFEQTCGNNLIEGTEECDDGNQDSGDGCDSACTTEQFALVRGRQAIDSAGTAADAADTFSFTADDDALLGAVVSDGEMGCPVGADSSLTLLDGQGDEVAFDDDGLGQTLCSLLDVAIPAGDYTLVVRGVDASALPAYTFGFRLVTDVTDGGRYAGAFAPQGSDHFLLRNAEEQLVEFRTSDGEGSCPGDTIITVFSLAPDGTLAEVARNDDADGGRCSRVTEMLPAGDYEIRVDAFDGAPIEAYALDVRFAGECGDGTLDAGEQCDDGNQVDDDFCNNACERIPGCGDGIIDFDEQCDDGNVEGGDGCDAECQREPMCGDGFVDGDETCDDGNLEGGDGCSALCTIECGNGELDAGEECDDGNDANGDGCDTACTLEQGEIITGRAVIQSAGFAFESSDTFTITADGPARLQARTSDGAGDCPIGGDTILTVFDDEGAEIGANDDIDDFNRCSMVDLDLPAAGTYTIVVEGFLGAPIDAYQLATRLTRDVSAGGPFPSGFVAGGDDRFVLVLDEADSVELSTSDGFFGCPGDTVMDLFVLGEDDAIGAPLLSNDDGVGETLCSLIGADLEAGAYEIRVRGLGGAAIPAYSLEVRFSGECGDGTADVGEECDDGNAIDDDFCNNQCVRQPGCGDTVVDPGEECDDGNAEGGDGCDAECQREPLCGDGFVDGDETCDDGNTDAGDGCDAECQLECGNEVVDPGEDCDDGNLENGDGCDATCSGENYSIVTGRADGELRIAEGSSDTFLFTVDGPSVLRALTSDGAGGCPAGVDTFIELLDDEGTVVVDNDDGAEGLCSLLQGQIEPGNYSIRVTGLGGSPVPGYTFTFLLAQDISEGGNYAGGFVEEGDDSYLLNVPAEGDLQLSTNDGAGGCPDDTIMTVYALGADGSRGEQVFRNDDGGGTRCSVILETFQPGAYEVVVNGFLGRAIPDYTVSVVLPGECGNGLINTNEECDDGNEVDDDFCSNACERIPGCGDFTVDPGEECDDGNTEGGDGCDAECQREPDCGDGFVDAPEQCDDGNTEDGDGCSALCTFEQECGNEIVEGTEECDDGNLDNDDGCDAACTLEDFEIRVGQVDFVSGGIAAGTEDTFQIVVDDDGDLAVGTSDGAGGCPADTVIRLYTVDGTQLASNDDAAGDARGLCSLLDTPIGPGTYTIQVNGFQGAAVPAYTLDFLLETDVSGGGLFRGAIAEDGNDRFRLELAADSDVTLRTTGPDDECPEEVDTILTIFDEGGNQVARNDDGGANGFCSQIGQNLTAGTYTVIVTGFSDGDVPPYLLRVEFPGGECGDGLVNPGETCDDGNTDNGDGCDDACQPEPQCGDGFVNQESEQCDDGNTASGDGCDAICSIENFDVINSRFANDGRFAEGSRDAYFFAIEEVSTVVALTSNGIGLGCPPGVDTVLTLFRIAEDGTRTQVARNDDDRGTFCSLINRSGLAPGRYVLESRDLGNNDAVDFYRLDLAIFADVNLGGVFRGGVALGGDDAFAFALPQGGPISLQTTGPQGGCSGDTVITVYPVDPITGLRGASVAGNDDGGDNGVCSLVEAELPAGNYEAVVTEFNDDSAIEAYRLRVILPGGVQPNDVDYCRAQFPVHARAMPGAEIDLFGVFYEEGITDASPQSDANPVVRAQIGWGDFESDPMDGGWQWIPAAPNPGWDGSQTGDPNDANNDEYFGTAVAPDEPGHYSWAFRVSVDNGLTWTLCDRGPAGSADGFEPALAGRLFVGDAPSPQGNELVITEIMQNSSNVADEFGEYVEIHNTSPGPLSLDGIALTDNQRTINLPDGIVLGFQEYFVIGRSNTLDPEFPDFNGGYICDLRVPELELGNSSDLVELTLGETQLDRVAYDNGATFPDPNGSSMQLDGSLNPEQADNALGINWCASSVQFGAGDNGTPGEVNPACALP